MYSRIGFSNFHSFEQMNSRIAIRSIFILLLAALSLVLLEIGGRFYVMAKFKTGFVDTSGLLFHYYNKIKLIQLDRKSLPPDQFRVLLLGGSVLNPNNGTIETHLRSKLSHHFGTDGFWVYNAAIPGHSSRDSYLKSILLRQYSFDLVIFYHGINETRANNCKAEDFRFNYDHMGWYSEVHNAFHYDSLAQFSCLPFLTQHFKILLRQMLSPEQYVPQDRPRPEDVEEGKVLKTPPSFRNNLTSVYDYCLATGADLLVPTFAYHLDSNYTQNLFMNRKLSYNPSAEVVFPVELWGLPKNVAKGIDAHNREARRASDELGFSLISMDRLLEKNASHFDDICHLSDSGCVRFVEILWLTIIQKAQTHEHYIGNRTIE